MFRHRIHRAAGAGVALLIGVALAGGTAVAQECELTFESFSSFGGPAHFNNGTYRVEWCVNGAQVSTSAFCMTGNVLRMNSSAHDPVAWLYVGDTGCTSVKLRFDFGSFVTTGTVLKYKTSTDLSLDCSATIGDYAGSLDLADGICHTAEHAVNLGPNDRSVYWKFDHGLPSANAFFLDNVHVLLQGCDCDATPPTHDCCETGGPGCDDPAVQACVCAIDPFCCTTAWDEQCVAEVDSFGCGTCGGGGCATEFSVGFGSFFQSGSVCTIWPALFETCEGSGPWISSGTACGGTGDYVMTFATGFPYSAAVTRCLDLSLTPAASLLFSYTKSSGLGPRIDISVGGGAFSTIWTAPYAPPGGCAAQCLDLGAYVGEPAIRLKFVSGSSSANGAAFDDILLVRGSGCATCTDPSVEAGPAKAVCPGQSVLLSGSASGGAGGGCPGSYVVSWSGLGIVSGGDTFSPTVDAPGQYFITAACDTCVSYDTVTVTLDDSAPVVDAGPTVSLPCGGGTLQLAGSAIGCTGNLSVSWTASGGGSIVSGADTLTPVVDGAGTYTLHASCDGGCPAADSMVVIERLPGDFDGNGSVGLPDFVEFAACLSGPGGGAPPSCACADLDADDDVDLVDHAAFQSAFGATAWLTGACCDMNGGCTETTASDCLAAGGHYHGDGDACAHVICPYGEYQNEVSPITNFFGDGSTLADDLTLAGIGARELTYYDLAVYGGSDGGGPFSVTAALYTDCPGHGGAAIAGTGATFSDVPDDGYVYILSADLSAAPITIPDTVWMVVTFSTAQAGWILAETAETGYTADLFGFDDAPWTCAAAFGGESPPHAGFWANLRCVPHAESRFVTGAPNVSITRGVRLRE
jgi:hypothetical protein